MKKFSVVLSLTLFSFLTSNAQESLFQRMEIITTLQKPPQVVRTEPRAQIKSIQSVGENFGIAYTADSLLMTNDSGETWSVVNVRVSPFQKIVGVHFEDRSVGYAVLADPRNLKLQFASTNDGGSSWTRTPVTLRDEDLAEADLEIAEITAGDGNIILEFRIPTSSNFRGTVRYSSIDRGQTWGFVDRLVVPNSDGEVSEKRSGTWTLTTEGTCAGFKTGCMQESKIVKKGDDITPPQIKALALIEKEIAKKEAEKTPMFALPPGGSTRISLSRGFDMCNAPTATQMQTWWNNSPLYDMNIYMSGRNRACSAQPNLSSSWVNQVTAMGWGLIPTVVGYQSPCTASTTTVKLSYDPPTAETQGREEADIAVTNANNLGLTTGSILYYDMERYDPPSPDTLGCRPATIAFLKGWTDRVKELGYKSGTYGSPKNAQEDWVTLPPASKMDAIWMARWDNVASVWTYVSFPTFPANEWANHQRIKQWQAPHNETWGGVTFNIDGNISDGPVAGIAVPKNRNADFDGDRKTDISVFRPDTGVWYVFNSATASYTYVQFGIGTDIPAPGDYDGDGKTDFAVFRPSDGTWHMLSKSGIYSSRPFGTTGDIPAPADFNGDGKTDIGVFRPSTGTWYISNTDSQGTYTIVNFGLDGDKTVQADYDGDGKADIAVWRPSNGAWYVLRSSDGGFSAVGFGLATDKPAQGDYDGDGKTDYAVLRDGVWYLLQSTLGYGQLQFGLAGDLAVTGDFDGDNKDDISVFRPSNGVWYMLQSQNGFGALQFGLAADKPIPNAYLPQ
jgi:hypothetical protein